MFCIAAFIILLFMAAVSARYRGYLKKAWGCVARRMTFRPCDTSFKNEAKSKLLAPVAVKHPRWLKAADIGLEIAAFIIILLTIWSVYVVAKSGLNLYVYGTCNPSNAASCSLGAEACSIDTATVGFGEAVTQFRLHEWIGNEFSSLGSTIAAIPTRMQTWDASDYLPANASFARPYDASKPTALKVIDPGCTFCAQLYSNIARTDFEERYNVSYIAYPIASDDGYQFANSLLVAQYLEAIRLQPLEDVDVPVDWRILDRIFTGTNDSGVGYQIYLNEHASAQRAAELLDNWLLEFGYSAEQAAAVRTMAESEQVVRIIADNKVLVEDRIKTVKIPTAIFDGRRHDGVVSTDRLQR